MTRNELINNIQLLLYNNNNYGTLSETFINNVITLYNDLAASHKQYSCHFGVYATPDQYTKAIDLIFQFCQED